MRRGVALMLNPKEPWVSFPVWWFQGDWCQVPRGLDNSEQWDVLLSPGGCGPQWQGRRSPFWQCLKQRHLTTQQHKQAQDWAVSSPRHRDSCAATHSWLAAWREKHTPSFPPASCPPVLRLLCEPLSLMWACAEEARPTGKAWHGWVQVKIWSMKRDQAKNQTSSYWGSFTEGNRRKIK